MCDFAVLLYVKSSLPQLRKCSPSLEAAKWFSYLCIMLTTVHKPEAWFLLLTTSRWFAVYLDVTCAIFVTVVAFGALIMVECKYKYEYLWYVYIL